LIDQLINSSSDSLTALHETTTPLNQSNRIKSNQINQSYRAIVPFIHSSIHPFIHSSTNQNCV
jgi:hypothetical protein